MAVADLSLDGVTATGNTNGFNVHNAAVITNATLTGVALDDNASVGLRVSTPGTIHGLTVTGGSLARTPQGVVASTSSALGDTSTVTGVPFLGSSFSATPPQGLLIGIASCRE